MSWKGLMQKCVQETKVFFCQNEQMLQQASTDFGKLVSSNCSAIAIPKTAEEVASLMCFANRHQLTLTPRSFGLSQSGQSLAPDEAIVMDLSQLQEDIEVNEDALSVRCQASASWQTIVEKLKPYQLIPNVLPLNLNLSIGGTLSVGGIGASSHLYGAIINNVLALKVVTGDGQIQHCSAIQSPKLFHATLAGLGRCGLITEVTLALRKYKPQTRTFFLLYTDYQQWLDDQKTLIDTQQVNYLEAFCSASLQGLRQTPTGRKPFAHWFYCLQVSYEHNETDAPTSAILANLHYWQLEHQEDMPTLDYLHRYAPRFEFMRKTGAWDLAHPWLECLVPIKAIKTLLPEILNQLPLSLGDGHRILHVAKQKEANTLFMQPTTQEDYVLFAILPVGIPDYALAEVLTALTKIHHLLIGVGGKRYLSGWLQMMDSNAWQQHYAEKYPDWLTAKQTFDPNKVLRSTLFP